MCWFILGRLTLLATYHQDNDVAVDRWVMWCLDHPVVCSMPAFGAGILGVFVLLSRRRSLPCLFGGFLLLLISVGLTIAVFAVLLQSLYQV